MIAAIAVIAGHFASTLRIKGERIENWGSKSLGKDHTLHKKQGRIAEKDVRLRIVELMDIPQSAGSEPD